MIWGLFNKKSPAEQAKAKETESKGLFDGLRMLHGSLLEALCVLTQLTDLEQHVVDQLLEGAMRGTSALTQLALALASLGQQR